MQYKYPLHKWLSILSMTESDKVQLISSQYIDSLRAGRSGDRLPVGARFSAPVQNQLWGLPSLLYNGYRVFPGGKAAGTWL